eukprot:m51a1_g6648 hypothetical protein (514) ;mRNA; f:125025-127303
MFTPWRKKPQAYALPTPGIDTSCDPQPEVPPAPEAPGYAERITTEQYIDQTVATPTHVDALVASPSFKVGHSQRPVRDAAVLAVAVGVSALVLRGAYDVWSLGAPRVPAPALGAAKAVVEGVVKHRLVAPASVALFYVSNYVGLVLFSHHLVPLTIVMGQSVLLLSVALLPSFAATYWWARLLWIPAVSFTLFILSYYSSLVLACKSLLRNWPLLLVVPVLHIAFEATYVPFALRVGLWFYSYPAVVAAVTLHCLWAYESLRCFVSVVTSGTVALWITRPSYTSPIEHVAEALARASRSSLGTVAISGALLNVLKAAKTLADYAGRTERTRWLRKALELLHRLVSRYVDYMLVYVGAYGLGFCEALSRSKHLLTDQLELLALQEVVRASWIKAAQRGVISATSLAIIVALRRFASLDKSFATMVYAACSVHMMTWCVLGRAIDTVTVLQVEQYRYVRQYPANVGGEASVLREISLYAHEAQDTRSKLAPVLTAAWRALGLLAVMHVLLIWLWR